MRFFPKSNINKLYKKDYLSEKKEKEKINKYIQTEGKLFSNEILLNDAQSKQWRKEFNKDKLKYKSNNNILCFKEIEKRFNIEMRQKYGYNKKFFDSFINLLSNSKSRNYIEKRKKIEELKQNKNKSEKGFRKSMNFYLTIGEDSKKNYSSKNNIHLTQNKNSEKVKINDFIYKSYDNHENFNFYNINNKKFGDEIELKEPEIIDNNVIGIKRIFFNNKKNVQILPKLNLKLKKNYINNYSNSSDFQSLSDRVYHPYQKEFLRNVYFKKQKEKLY